VSNDYCEECERAGRVLCCARCPLAWHPRCCTPRYESWEATPKAGWVCPKCIGRDANRARQLAALAALPNEPWGITFSALGRSLAPPPAPAAAVGDPADAAVKVETEVRG
jgi:hypothetical protein